MHKYLRRTIAILGLASFCLGNILVARNISLSNLVAGLEQEYHTSIVISPEAASLNITTVLPNTNLQDTLDSIAKQENLFVRHIHGVWFLGQRSNGIVLVPVRRGNPSDIAASIHTNPALQSVIAIPADRDIALMGDPQMVQIAKHLIQTIDSVSSIPESISIPGFGNIAATAKTISQAVGKKVSIVPDLGHGSIIVTGTRHNVDAVRPIIARLLAPPIPILIRFTAIDYVPRNDTRSLGFTLGGIANNTSAGTSGAGTGSVTTTPWQFFTDFQSALSFGATLQALREHGTAKILASGQFATVSGQIKKETVGESVAVEIPNGGIGGGYQSSITNTGLTLSFLPIATADGGVYTSIDFQFNRIIGTNSLGVPTTSGETDSGSYELRPHQSVLLTGLTLDQESKTVQKVPLLGDIPLFGKLFRFSSSSVSNETLIIRIEASQEIASNYNGQGVQ